MAGSDAGFNAEAFRDAIHQAMSMGAAPDAAQQVQWYLPSTLTYNVAVDGAHVPFDPAATVTRTTPPPVRVDCAVEYLDAEGQPTSFGLMTPSRVAITVLDVDYERIKTATHVVIHGDRYNYRRTEPPGGLFDVGLYVIHFTGADET